MVIRRTISVIAFAAGGLILFGGLLGACSAVALSGLGLDADLTGELIAATLTWLVIAAGLIAGGFGLWR